MNFVNLDAGGIYVLSGPPTPQKSDIVARSNLPAGTVVSADQLRSTLLGTLPDLGGNTRLFDCADMAIFDIMRKMVEVRAAQRLTTVIDATNVNDETRSEYVRIAEKYGVPAKVLLVDVEEDVARAANAESRTPAAPEKLKDFFTRWQRQSRFPFELIPVHSTLALQPNSLPHDKVDVIGDVHGLYDDLLALLARKGWVLGDDGVLRHPEGRLLVFLGDLIDRGLQSLEVLRLVKRAVDAGTAICIQGNHELKAVRFWDMVSFKGVANWSSYASAETCVAMLKLPREEATGLVDFMRKLPASLVYEPAKVAFLHADVERYDPLMTPKADCLYGHSKHGMLDADEQYQKRFDAGLNQYTLFRGHVTQASVQENVFSLERDQAFAGELVLLQLDVFLQHRDRGNRAAFEAAVMTQKCEFNFDHYSKKFALAKALDYLTSKKQVYRHEEAVFGLKVYKAGNFVVQDAVRGHEQYLAKAKGIVMDVAGNIVVHPLDKLPLYSTGLLPDSADSYQVVAAEKLHGYPVEVVRHPFKPGELLVTSEDGFAVRHLDYAKALVSGRTKSAMLKFLSRRDVTLSIQVLRNDSHSILSYRTDQFGLYLVGVRGLEEDSLPWTEDEVDGVARDIGLRRASWFKATLGEVKKLNLASETEGFLVREYSREEKHLFVLKSPSFLTKKLLAKLPDEKLPLLFKYPESFKKEVSEDLYALVDWVNANCDKESFLAMPMEARADALSKFVAGHVA